MPNRRACVAIACLPDVDDPVAVEYSSDGAFVLISCRDDYVVRVCRATGDCTRSATLPAVEPRNKTKSVRIDENGCIVARRVDGEPDDEFALRLEPCAEFKSSSARAAISPNGNEVVVVRCHSATFYDATTNRERGETAKVPAPSLGCVAAFM